MNSIYPVLLAIVVFWWLNLEPQFDWQPSGPIKSFEECPRNTTDKLLIFGGTSLLGRYIVESWRNDEPYVCLINFGRNPCPRCHISVIGDMRDIAQVEQVFEHYRPSTVLTSTKPPLEGAHYRAFIEINVAAIYEITRVAKQSGVEYFLHVSSIAASSHFIEHHMANESCLQPLYTEYQAHYDISKRLGEDFVLSLHDEGKFNTVAIRVSGIIGGEGDQFFHHRIFPFILTFDSPVILDYGYAGNIADALVEMSRRLKQDNRLGGQFYYYTGEHIFENQTAIALSQYTGKPLLKLPQYLLDIFLIIWQRIRWDHNRYTLIDLLRCASVEQTFDQSKFFKAFPDFKPKYTVLEALELLYASKDN